MYQFILWHEREIANARKDVWVIFNISMHMLFYLQYAVVPRLCIFYSSGESRLLFRSIYVEIDKYCKFGYKGDFLFKHDVCRVERGYHWQQIRLRDYRLRAHQACKGILGRVLPDWFLQIARSKSQKLDLQINKHTIKNSRAGQKEWIRSLAVVFGYFCIADVFIWLNPLETIRN